MSSRSDVFLQVKATGEYVAASLIDGINEEQVGAAETGWREVFDAELARLKSANVPPERWPQHAHWDWRKKHAVTDGILAYQMLGIECEGQMQGLVLLKTAGVYCRFPDQKGRGLVYVWFLSTAPWNSPTVVTNPRFGQVGTVLLAAAIQVSFDLGFNGRIGLHSLPQSEVWYEKNGMVNLGKDAECHNLRYFEMTPQQAERYLR